MKKNGDVKKSGFIYGICAVTFVVLFAVANFDSVSGVFSSILNVFSPVIIGFAIAYILNPLLRTFEFKVYKKIKKVNVVRVLSLISTYIAAFLIVIAMAYLLIPSIIASVEGLIDKYDTYVEATVGFINSIINKLVSNGNFTEYVNEQNLKAFIVRFFSDTGNFLDNLPEYITEYGMSLFVGVKNLVLGLFISIYVLISKEKLQAQVRKFGTAFLPESKTRRLGRYINLTHRTFSSYFVGNIIDSAIVLLITLVVLLLTGMPYALLVSVIVGVTNLIPIFGPIIGAIPSFFIIFIVDPKKAFIFLILIILIQQLDGNVIAPKILGNSTGVSSLCIIIAIVVMGSYFGIIGMLVGVPLFAVGITIVKEVIETKLRAKGKDTDTAEYYLKDAMVDPYYIHEHIGAKFFRNIGNIIKSFIRLLYRMIKKNPPRWTKHTDAPVNINASGDIEKKNYAVEEDLQKNTKGNKTDNKEEDK